MQVLFFLQAEQIERQGGKPRACSWMNETARRATSEA